MKRIVSGIRKKNARSLANVPKSFQLSAFTFLSVIHLRVLWKQNYFKPFLVFQTLLVRTEF